MAVSKRKDGKHMHFCSVLHNMLKDESKAGDEYQALAGLSEDKKAQDVILSIRDDEKKHFKKLKDIAKKYCGG